MFWYIIIMDPEVKSGDLLILTKEFDDYVRKRYVYVADMANRIAKLNQIIDWDSPTGIALKMAREKSGKWKDLCIEDNKYIVSIYYPELPGRKGEKGVIEHGKPMFRYHPETKKPFFLPIPDWMKKDILRECETITVELKHE